MRTVAFCEIDPYCRAVLGKHWPDVPCYGDIRELSADRLAADGIGVDVICGGFPCQDISIAGKGAGLAGERSGLWTEFARLIGEIRPSYAFMENVSALLSRGLGDVLGDLAEIGYDAEWHCIPASHVGAPHRRDRIWIVAHANSSGTLVQGRHGDRYHEERHPAAQIQKWQNLKFGTGGSGWWTVEPRLGRMAHGVPNRAHRLRVLGNAVVPQIPEIIGRAIMLAQRIK